MVIAIVLSASSGDGCFGGFVIFIIMISIFVSIISSIQNTVKTRGAGGSLLGPSGMDFLSQVEKELKTGAYTSLEGFQAPSPYAKTSKKSRPPINWRVVKLSLPEDKLKECFDMDTLSRGVKKKDLPKYVHLDKLRKYFTDPQLKDMIDLEFFEAATAAAAAKISPSSTLKVELKGLKHQDISGKFLSKPTSPSVTKIGEAIPEMAVSESFAEVIPTEAVTVPIVEDTHFEKVMEEFHALAHEDPFFDDISRKLTKEERLKLAEKVIAISEETAGMESENLINGIIWNEILKRRTPGRFCRG